MLGPEEDFVQSEKAVTMQKLVADVQSGVLTVPQRVESLRCRMVLAILVGCRSELVEVELLGSCLGGRDERLMRLVRVDWHLR